MDLILNVQPRTETGRHAKQVRHAGFVPGVVYGQGKDARPLQFREIDLVRLIRHGASSQLVELQGLDKDSLHTLLREVQRHPTRHTILHADFYEVQMNVVIRTEVPVHFEGESPAMVEGGAILIHNLDRIEVECLPRDIPDRFVLNLDLLETIDDVVHVSDLAIPENVTIVNDPEDVIASLTIPRKLAEEEELEAEEGMELEVEEGMAEPEVISRGKEEEED